MGNDGFKTSLFEFIRKLEVDGVVAPGLTFHGLRHTVAKELRELGFDNRMIADMLGQNPGQWQHTIAAMQTFRKSSGQP